MQAPKTTRGPRVILALAFFLVGSAPGGADLLIRGGGEESHGSLLSMDVSSLRFRTEGGEELSLPRDQVTRLELYRDLSGTRARTLADLEDPVLEEAMQYLAGPEQYPNDGAVNLYLGYHMTFEADGSTRLTVRNIVRVLQERGKGEGTVSGSWIRDLQRFHFDHGRTILPDGSIRGLTDKGVRVSAVHTSVPEYDRKMRQLQTLPAVDVGSVVDWQYTIEDSGEDPFLPAFLRHVVRLGEPVMRGVFEVRLHRDRQWDGVLSRTEGVSRRRWEDGDYRVERFEWVGLEPGKREDRKPPGEEIYPAFYFGPRLSWAEIAEPVRAVVTSATEAGPLTRELLEKLLEPGWSRDRIYQTLALWVAREIRLVRVLMSDFRYAPRSIEEVLSTRSGNYLDKTMALHALLRAAGVPSELYLSRDRYLSPMPEGARSLELFNDALVRVELDEGWVFRSPDDEELDPGVLPAAFHGTSALRISGERAPEGLTEVPDPPLEDDLLRTVYRTQLEVDGTLVGSRDLQVRGNSARTVRSYRNLSRDQLQKRMESLNHSFHPSSELTGYELRNLADFTKDVSYVRRFRVPGYALKAGGKLLAFRLPGLVDSSGDVGTATRRYPMAYRSRELQDTEIEVRLPEGFRVLHLPQGMDVEGPGYRYRSEFSREGDLVRFRGEYRRTTRRIQPEDYPAYKRMREERSRQARQWVVVEKLD